MIIHRKYANLVLVNDMMMAVNRIGIPKYFDSEVSLLPLYLVWNEFGSSSRIWAVVRMVESSTPLYPHYPYHHRRRRCHFCWKLRRVVNIAILEQHPDNVL